MIIEMIVAWWPALLIGEYIAAAGVMAILIDKGEMEDDE